jgi:DNA-binding NtrC family response regulator
MIRDGLFREDLYYRLNVLGIDVPPLREREGDLPLLAQYFLNKFHRRGSPPARISPAAWSALAAFAFPGNVRQLGHAIEHATVMAMDGEIEPRHLPAEITEEAGAATGARPAPQTLHGAAEAIRILGISRKNLREKLRGDKPAN